MAGGFEKASKSDMGSIVALRHKVLHPGGPAERVLYDEDDDETTLHLILKDGDEVKACGTLIYEGEGVFRIRGMAVSETLRGQGLGSKLVDAFVDYAKSNESAQQVWCNGRVAALGLYERKGFVKTGSVFDVPGSGPHYKLILSF